MKKKMLDIGYPLLLILLIALTGLIWGRQLEKRTAIVVESIEEVDGMLHDQIVSNNPRLHPVKKLQQQNEMIEILMDVHLGLALDYNRYTYLFAGLFAICATIASLLLMLILKVGWDNMNNHYVKTTLVVFLGLAILFKTIPEVFDNQENIENNMQQFNIYSGLQMEIYSLLNDDLGLIKNDDLDALNMHVRQINMDIRDTRKMYFSVRPDKVKFKNDGVLK